MNSVKLNKRQLRNRVKWVRALLSGNYEQGNFKLKRADYEDGSTRYCCLGVACELVTPHSPALKYASDDNKISVAYMNTEQAYFNLGLIYEDQLEAAVWNDKEHHTFARIADLVAYATDNGLRFDQMRASDVEDDYANEWLRQFDQ